MKKNTSKISYKMCKIIACIKRGYGKMFTSSHIVKIITSIYV